MIRTLLFALLVATGSGLAAGSAGAAVLPWTGTFSFQFSALPSVQLVGSGTLSLNGSGGLGALTSVTLPAGAFVGVVSVPVTDPGAFPVSSVKGSFVSGGGTLALGGVLPITGNLAICLFAACNGAPAANVNVPFTQMGTRGVGIGGGPISIAGLTNLTLLGAPWSTGMVSLGAEFDSVTGFVHGPASGGAATAATVSGVIRLVTPVQIQTNVGQFPLSALGVLELRFVPEPGTFLLLASGAVGLAWMGRRRRGA